MNGILLINKPKNFTSFDVVAKLRRIFKIKKIGHAGTLDPMATGVLPILLGNATKIQELLQNSDKEYLATFKLGLTTDTLDITGKVLSESVVNVSLDDIKNILPKFCGEINQVPPMFSAIKKNGIKLYDLARKGISIKRDPRLVTINSIDLTDFDGDIIKILVSCSKGTYIRSLCSDIGNNLGCGAVLTELSRTKACSFSIDDCLTLEELEKLYKENTLSNKLIPIPLALKYYKKISITAPQASRFKNGGPLDLNRLNINYFDANEIFQVFFEDQFLGLGIINLQKNQLDIFKLLFT